MHPAFTWRPYNDVRDLIAMRAFLSAAYRASERGLADGLWHPGDMTWAVFLNSLVGPIDRGDLWFDGAGELAAIVWRYKGGTEMSIRPNLQASTTLTPLLRAILRRHDDLQRIAGDPVPLTIGCSEGHATIPAALLSLGCKADNTDPMTIFRMDLATTVLPTRVLADGFTLRALAGPADYPDRVAIHREVWAPSQVTIDGFARLQDMPGYDRALDIVAVAPDGRFAAYCILWHDPATRSCHFEPVGARKEFRGRGLASAMLVEALRRAQARGVETAWVYTDEARTAAQALYRSVGFTAVGRYIGFVRA